MRHYEIVDKLLTENGWSLNCTSPLEIEHIQTCDTATGIAAQIVIEKLFEDEGYED
jgi:hypothetical protein